MVAALYGPLTIVAFVALLVFAACMFVFVRRLTSREQLAISEGIGAKRAVLAKVRKREPMSRDELQYATQVIADQRSPLAFSIPATIFTLGCFYVLGSLYELHGARPSERTFIGLIPMISSINVTLQLLRVAKLKRRLPSQAALA